MGTNDHEHHVPKATSPPLEALVHAIDRQIERVPHIRAAKGQEDFWGSQVGEYKKPDEQYIRFVLDRDIFAVPLQHAVEIDYLPDVTPLPNLPKWVLGICNLRGDLSSVVDIKQFFGLNSDRTGGVKKLILIRDQEVSTAIIVDKILGMLFADDHRLQGQTEGETNKQFSRFVQGTIAADRQTVHLLDVERLIKGLAI